ncbi:MAG: BlaI/MecI/CopY family transcriptional regulator [Lachnospiraceae bacterium]|nr:BlaI/MecI/CopY family transcriptional regulator [Lachnospiraceae bacterium]
MARQKTGNSNLTKRDLEVMTILWSGEGSKTASLIVKDNPELTMNTVQAVLRKLLKDKLIKVADIVYSGTVLTRSYEPMISQEKFWIQKLVADYQEISNKVSKADIVTALLDTGKGTEKIKEDISEIDAVLDSYKKKYL